MNVGLFITSLYKTCTILAMLLILIRMKKSKEILQRSKHSKKELLIIAFVFGILGCVSKYLPQDNVYGTTIATTRVIIVSGGILFGNIVGIVSSIITMFHLPFVDVGCAVVIPEMLGLVTSGIIASIAYEIMNKYNVDRKYKWIIGILVGILTQYIAYLQIKYYIGFLSYPKEMYANRLFQINNAMMVAQIPIGIFVLVIDDISNEKKISGMEKLEWELNKSKLHILQSQINPHFLFNTLNVIGLLTAKNPQKAREIIVGLSKYIRYNLELQGEFISIKKEIEQVKCYIGIQAIRFGDDFEVIYDIDENIDTKIPSLIIQPLVENALEHGVLKSGNKGEIRICIEKEKKSNKTHIVIKNTGVPINQEIIDNLDNYQINMTKENMKSVHIGLKNVHTRLKLIYGEGLIINRLNNGTSIEMYIGGFNESYNN